METAYNTRYGNSDPVSGFLGVLPVSFLEDRFLAVVRRAEDFARKLASPGDTILVYEDADAPLPAEYGRDGELGRRVASADGGDAWG